MLKTGITRDRAWELLTTHLHTPNLVKHCVASEAVMAAAAPRLDEDPTELGIVGLVHDVDLDIVGQDMERHGLVARDLLVEAGMTPEAAAVVASHNESNGSVRSSAVEHLLAAAETLTGLIVAVALVMPDKRLASVKPKSVRKRFKEKRFAAGAKREIIRECELAGFELDEFLELGLEAMKGIAGEIGL